MNRGVFTAGGVACKGAAQLRPREDRIALERGGSRGGTVDMALPCIVRSRSTVEFSITGDGRRYDAAGVTVGFGLVAAFGAVVVAGVLVDAEGAEDRYLRLERSGGEGS